MGTWTSKKRRDFLKGIQEGTTDLALRLHLQNMLNEANRVNNKNLKLKIWCL